MSQMNPAATLRYTKLIGRELSSLENDYLGELAGMDEEWKDALILSLLSQRSVDGHNGRPLDVEAHSHHEAAIVRLMDDKLPASSE